MPCIFYLTQEVLRWGINAAQTRSFIRKSALRIYFAISIACLCIFSTSISLAQLKSDIVGNDGRWGITGHVGISQGGSLIAEVQNNDSGINGSCIHRNKPLADFRNDANYWGMRFFPDWTDSVREDIFAAFIQQGKDFRAQYTKWLSDCCFGIKNNDKYVYVAIRCSNGYCVIVKRNKCPQDAHLVRCDFNIYAASRYNNAAVSYDSFRPYSLYLSYPSQR